MKGPQWLTQRELAYKRTGKLNLTGVNIDSLAAIGPRKTLKELNLSRTNVESLEGLTAQKSISSFIADNSKLNSLKNFKAIANATSISVKNTPLSQMKHFMVAVRVICGNTLKVLNGKQIPTAVDQKAATYPPFVSDLLNAGWPFVYPCPDPNTLKNACQEYQVSYNDEDFHTKQDSDSFNNDSANDDLDDASSNESSTFEGESYLDTLGALILQHQEMIEEADLRFETVFNQYAICDEQDQFQRDLKQLLEKYDFKFNDDQDINTQLEETVRELCAKAHSDDEDEDVNEDVNEVNQEEEEEEEEEKQELNNQENNEAQHQNEEEEKKEQNNEENNEVDQQNETPNNQ